ncbi:rab effector MyRIP isoform X2 [Protopterus annectens]|uniref:rab effector MyRIP isoform X2 n=1 Tax=Protopterus annectens TaxID=7888 RepID=UPI001CFA46DC|nr:rab effector MyRIP isoform X2 [Protopterus annectens]
MGRKLDLSGLTEAEAEHVFQVVQRDFSLRKKEEDRLTDIKQKLNEEGSRCAVLSKQQKFNEHCCIRCYSPFSFLINAKRQCLDCKYNICKACSTYIKKEKASLCNVCQQARLLKTQSLEWYYSNVKSRFKRFGSAKVLKNLYRKHLMENDGIVDLREGSICEEILENDGSICGSDSTFYRETAGHTMADTLAVAIRVAQEAVEEAISKAEMHRDSLEKQKEAYYLREHKEELTEELTTTIMQKIIHRQKSLSTQSESECEWTQSRSSGLVSPSISDHSMLAMAKSRRESSALWRSRSAFSLISDNSPSKDVDLNSSLSDFLLKKPEKHAQGRPGPKLSSLPSWKSTDHLNSSGSSSTVHSPDGNWMAKQCTALTQPRRLSKPNSQLFKALENDSHVASAYDTMGYDSDDDVDMNVAFNELQQLPRKLSDESYYTDSQYDSEWINGNEPQQSVTSPSSGQCTNTETMYSGFETSPTNSLRDVHQTDELPLPKRKAQGKQNELHAVSNLDINLNPQAGSTGSRDSSEPEDAYCDLENKSRRKRKNRPHSEEICKESYYKKIEKRFSTPSQEDSSREDAQHKSNLSDIEVQLKSRLLELASKVSDREVLSVEDQDLVTKLEKEESLSHEENVNNTQEELRKETCKVLDLHLKLQFLSSVLQQKYSAVSLCNISTEVLKVINATEELIEEATVPSDSPSETCDRRAFPLTADPVILDEQLTKLEENVYMTAGAVYGQEGQLSKLENSARCINCVSTETELAELEDQVATSAAQVQQTEIQISDIEKRIAALTQAGLNVAPCARLAKRHDQKELNQVQTIDTSRQQRRKLPAPPSLGQQTDIAVNVRTFNKTSKLQGSSTQKTSKERKNYAKDIILQPSEDQILPS